MKELCIRNTGAEFTKILEVVFKDVADQNQRIKTSGAVCMTPS